MCCSSFHYRTPRRAVRLLITMLLGYLPELQQSAACFEDASGSEQEASSLAHTFAPAPRALKVLVAENNPVDQTVLMRLLKQLGCQVELVDDGPAAVEAVRQHSYELVLIDLQLPQLDGVAAARLMRALGPVVHQPLIVALTTSVQAGDSERYQAAGINGYLVKPPSREALMHVLTQLARQGRDDGSVLKQPSELDQQQLGRLLNDMGFVDPAELAELVEAFCAQTDELLASSRAALAVGDRGKLAQHLHRLRGGALQLGAGRLAALCSELEHQIARGQHLGLETSVDRLAAQCAATVAALRRYVGSGSH